MPAFLTLDSLSAAAPDGARLFDNLTLSVGAERVGLVGRNGAGKSTLLRIVAGQLPPASGSVAVQGRVGRLEQDWGAERSVSDVLGVRDALARVARIVAGAGSESDLAEADWTLEARVESVLAELGLSDIDLDRPIGSLSGGERMRIGIARLMIEAPDVLLLDEPTNNLDAAGRAAIDRLIAGATGAVLIASHDRVLLEAMDRIVELTPVGCHVVGGGWSTFAAERDAARARAAGALDSAARDAKAVARAAQTRRETQARRDRAGAAYAASGSAPKILMGRQAERAQNSAGRGETLNERAREAAAERLDAARAQVEVLAPLTITLPPSGLPANRELLAMEAVRVRNLGPWTLQLRGPERVALTGANGAGKSTLLAVAAGRLAPDAGEVRRVCERIALLDQHVSLLDPQASVVDNFRRLHRDASANDGYAAAARFAFRNSDAERLVATLSGGERLRAGLACVLGGAVTPWLLMLDEPTNHLDIAAIEVLEAALRGYDGGLLVVSHDRAFLQAIGIAREVAIGDSGSALRQPASD